jgi:hypothetical protein
LQRVDNLFSEVSDIRLISRADPISLSAPTAIFGVSYDWCFLAFSVVLVRV